MQAYLNVVLFGLLAALAQVDSAKPDLEACRAQFLGGTEYTAGQYQSDGKFSQEERSASPSSFSASINEFGFKLFNHLHGSQNGALPLKNVVASPLSIILAFSILYDGATEGSVTQQEIAAAFGFESDECYTILLKDAIQKLVAGKSDGNELSVASKVFVDNGLKVAIDFSANKELAIVDFGTPSSAAEEINQFVSSATRGLVPKAVEAADLDPTLIMSIVNAVYFKGEWGLKFDSSKNEKGMFTKADGTSKEVTFMVQNEEFKISQTSEPAGTFLELPYRGGRYAMHLFLPTETNDMQAFMSKLSFGYWRGVTGEAGMANAKVMLPKFDIESTTELREALGSLSPPLNRIFTEDAELGRLSPETGAFVGSAVHRARIKVDEEGTEAAATTELKVHPLSATPDFIADKPFTFFITDKGNDNLIIFMGSVMDP